MKLIGHETPKGRHGLLLTLAIAVGLLGLAVGFRGRYTRFMVQQCREQLPTVSNARAESLVDQVAGLGEPGIPVLVEALGSSRPSVARAARRAIFNEVDRWESLHARESSPLLARLAEVLAARAKSLGPAAAQDANDLAVRILVWPLDRSQIDRAHVVACCEKILRVTSGGPRPMYQTPRTPQPRDPNGPKVAWNASGASIKGPEKATSALPAHLPDNVSPENEVVSRVADPHAPNASTPSGPLLDASPALRWVPGDTGPATGVETEEKAPRRLRPLAFQQVHSDVGSASPITTVDQIVWSEIGPLELMRWLENVDIAIAFGARRELERRGFTAVHFAMARELFDPDPAVRIGLARRLPGLNSIDAVPWLLYLSEDVDPNVRRAAIALMGTTRDPAVLERVERIAREDPDPAVQRQAGQIARQRDAVLR